MIVLTELAVDLNAHRNLCEELLTLVEKENASFHSGDEVKLEANGPRKKFLGQLSESLDKLREHRVAWSKLEPSERKSCPEINDLLRENQNLIMKILVLDRENEQSLLRNGLVPPRHVPPANRQRPHFVANMYQRHSTVSP